RRGAGEPPRRRPGAGSAPRHDPRGLGNGLPPARDRPEGVAVRPPASAGPDFARRRAPPRAPRVRVAVAIRDALRQAYLLLMSPNWRLCGRLICQPLLKVARISRAGPSLPHSHLSEQNSALRALG